MNVKYLVSCAAGVVGGFFGPIVPYAALCSAMVLLDCASAVALSFRLRRKGVLKTSGKISSKRFGRVLVTLVKIYVSLGIAAGVQALVLDGSSFNALRFVTALVCFWQLMSILENESTCSDARWAAIARRYLADKTRRHTGIDL